MIENPILGFCYPGMSGALSELLMPFYKFSFDQSTAYGMGPEGEMIPLRQFAGLTNFFKINRLAQYRRPQTLFITSLPDGWRPSGSLNERYQNLNCLHFLMNIFFENGFKFLIWNEKRKQFVEAANAGHLLSLFKDLNTPNRESWEELKKTYPHSLLSVNHELLDQTLQGFARILSKVCTEQLYTDYSQSRSTTTFLESKDNPLENVEEKEVPRFYAGYDLSKLEGGINEIINNFCHQQLAEYSEDIKFELEIGNLNFKEKLDLSQLNVKTIAFTGCVNVCPDFNKLPTGLRSIRLSECNFIDWDPEIIINGSNSPPIAELEIDLLPTCTIIKAHSPLKSFGLFTNVFFCPDSPSKKK